MLKGKRILLIVAGGLAAFKAQELIRQSLGEHVASHLPPEEIEGRALLLGALFNGLTVMSVRYPAMQQQTASMAPVMRRVLQVLMAP